MSFLSLSKRGSTYYAIGVWQGERVRRSLGTSSLSEAKAKLPHIELEVVSKPSGPASPAAPLFNEIASKYMRSARTGSSPSARHYALKLADHFGHEPIDAIDEHSIEGYIERYHMARGNSSGTIRRDLTALQSILNFGARLGHRSPIKIDKPPENPHATDTLTTEEEAAIFKHLHPDVHRMCVFMLRTGARPIEMQSLIHADLDWDSQTVVLRSIKGRKGALRTRRIPLHPEVLATIPRRPDHRKPDPSERVFRLNRRDDWAMRSMNNRWNTACKAAGVSGKTPYCLRHTFATRLARRNVPPKVIADLMGHASLDMVMRYMNTTFEDHKNAVLLT